VREWNLFAQHQRPVPLVRANRGANGIDGQLSTWLGATAREENAWAMVGDLTALYDLAAPFLLGPCGTKGRVLVVINNGGGRIFERLPRLADMQSTARELMVNPHAIELAGWAAMWRMSYCRVSQLDDLDNFTAGETMTLLEVIPDRQQTGEFWERWDRLT
jgi:2-succinyl-5-enolpyruvyl-6-hydroxy-3-cyclohexene-1-carboxylate synthase